MRKMKNNHPHISSNMTLFIKLLSLYALIFRFFRTFANEIYFS